MKRCFLVLAVLLLMAAPVHADFAAGLAAYKRGDYANALKEFKKLADRGHASAQFNLGIMYGQGQGTTQNYIKAHMWLNLTVSSSTGKERETYSKGRDLVEKLMTWKQVAEAKRLAREWKPKKAKTAK